MILILTALAVVVTAGFFFACGYVVRYCTERIAECDAQLARIDAQLAEMEGDE